MRKQTVTWAALVALTTSLVALVWAQNWTERPDFRITIYPIEIETPTSDLLEATDLRLYRAERFGPVLTQEETETLGAMLANPNYRNDWFRIARTIAAAGTPELASDTLHDFIRRPEQTEGLRQHEVEWLYMWKAMAIGFLGFIGTEDDREMLHKAISLDGAKDLASDWIEDAAENASFYSELEVLAMIQGRAGYGLAYLDSRQDRRKLRNTYASFRTRVTEIDFQKQRSDSDANAESVFGQLTDAMALSDYVATHGRELALHDLYFARSDDFDRVYIEYGRPYRFEYWE